MKLSFSLLILLLLTLCAFKVHDGDTITRISYRLAYIDAPELDQTCSVKGKNVPLGQMAQSKLQALVSDSLKECDIVDTDRYGRAVVDCKINFIMVKEGFAVCYDRFMNREQKMQCHALQTEAEHKREGMWACDRVVMPGDYRKAKKQSRSRDGWSW